MRTTPVWIAASALTCVACSPLATPTIGSVIASVVAPLQTTAPSSSSPPTAYTASPFISGPYSEYYSGFEATQTSVQPQPKVSDWTRGRNYQLNLTNPATIPVANVVDPVVLPPSRKYPNVEAEVFAPVGKNFSTVDSIAARTKVYTEISAMIAMNATGSATCGACKAGLVSAQSLAYDYPWEIQSLLLSLCTKFTTSKTCNTTYTPQQSGAIAQILSFANVTGMDGVMLCAKQLPVKNLCPIPAVSPYDASLYFNTTEPLSKVAPTPSGQTTKVLHLSDFHLDPRYTTGSESACTGYLCCRPGGINSSSMSVPAPRYGAYQCDTPWDLAMSAMTAIPVLTGTQDKGFNFTIYTGDLVSHDQDNALGRDYIEYTESVVFGFFSHYLGSGPTYAALGNHDSWPQALNSLNSLASLGDYLKDQFSWNYAHLAALWQHAGWIKEDEANLVRTHYGAYSTITSGGLRIITLNTDFFYTANLFNYINMTDPDPSGTLKFVADELQRAENNGQRAWIIGHVLPGWDGSAGLRNPSDLFSQIQNRYSPHVLAAVFMGHIHDELVYTNYANNGTVKNASTAMTTTWVGPSLTPLTGLNSGFRMYEVDQKTFDIVDSHTFYSNVSEYASLDGQTQFGPSYHYEYSAREAYGANITWPATAPLNATWWHLVTEQMQRQPSLVDQFAKHQGRLSPRTKNCTSDACVAAKICYMKSGTAAQGQTCTPGFSSVQN